MNYQELEQWAATRETSEEIAQAIFEIARGDKEKANSIWEAPTWSETEAVKEIAFKKARFVAVLYWGVEEIYRTCPECSGIGHTIGFEGNKKIYYPCSNNCEQ